MPRYKLIPNVGWTCKSYVGELKQPVLDALKVAAVHRGDEKWGMTGPREYFGTMIKTHRQSYTISKVAGRPRHFRLRVNRSRPRPLRVQHRLSPKLPPGIVLSGDWYTTADLKAGRLPFKPDQSLADNVFGASGVFVTPVKPIIFPQYDIRQFQTGLETFGAKLVKWGEPLPLTRTQTPIMLASYYFGDGAERRNRYQRDYALAHSGTFMERHPFPQLFAPMSPHCGGYIVIGKELSPSMYYLTAVKIPYGYILVTSENVIHGDTFFQGPYLASLSFVGNEDTVFVKSNLGLNVPFNRCGERYNINWEPHRQAIHRNVRTAYQAIR
jgi:hypothetical protein